MKPYISLTKTVVLHFNNSCSLVNCYCCYFAISHLRPCPACYKRAGVKWVIKADKDKKIKFCCLQSKAAEPYMRACGVEKEDVLRRFLFIEGPGLYHQGSTGTSFLLILVHN